MTLDELIASLPHDVTVVTIPIDPDSLPGLAVIRLVKKESVVARHPVGKGYFIWQLRQCANGSPTLLADMAKEAGLDWVAIKVCEGPMPFSSNGDISPWVAQLRSVGVRVWGWGYAYGNDPVGEADAALMALSKFGLDGYIIDAEGEYKGKNAQAKTYTWKLREALPNNGIGLCSYRYPSLHKEIPWAEFLAGCDFHMPQVYWLGATSPTAPGVQLARSITELRALLDIPVIPIGVACDHPVGSSMWRPTVAQLNNFDLTAKGQANPQGVGWWSWQHSEGIPEFWEAIKLHG